MRQGDRQQELGHAPTRSLLVRYSTPAIIAMVANALYNVADAVFVGRGAGTIALAALAICFNVQFLFLGIAQLVGIGAQSMTSRFLGSEEPRKAAQTAGTAFTLSAILGAGFAALGFAYLRPLLNLLGASETVMIPARMYLAIVLLGSPFFAFAVSSNSLVRAEGAITHSMISMLLGAGVNLVLDYIFIFGLGLGIAGAAWATVIAQFCGFAYLCWFYISRRTVLDLHLRDLMPAWALVPEMLAVGSASLVRVTSGVVMMIVVMQSIRHYGTDTHIAIVGVAFRVMMLIFLPLIGLAHGFQPIVGFNYGAGRIRRVRQVLWQANFAGSVMSTAGFLACTAFAPLVMSMFSPDPEVVIEGAPVLRLLVLAFATVGFQVIGVCLFQSIGKGLPALMLSLLRQVFLMIPLVLLLPRWLGLSGIWWSFPIADGASAVVTLVLLFGEVRRLRRLSRAEPAPVGGPVEKSAE